MNLLIKNVLIFLGRQFDKDGNMMQWWNNATIRAFRERTQCIIDQYSRYKIDEVGLYVNGRMTQGENIADNGGLKQAFRVCLFYSWHFPSFDIFSIIYGVCPKEVHGSFESVC